MLVKSGDAFGRPEYSSWSSWDQYNGTSVGPGHSALTPVQGAFYLEYEPGPRKNADGSPHWKECHHEKGVFYEYKPLEASSVNRYGRRTVGVLGSWFTNLCQGVGSYASEGFLGLPPFPSLATTYQDHLNEIYGQVKPSMLSMENLASLFGGKSLFKTTETALRALLALNLRNAKTFKEAIKALAGLDLAKSFSVDSTARDIESTINLFEGWRQHIAKLRARQSADYMLYKTTRSNQTSESQTCEWVYNDTGVLPSALFPANMWFNEKRTSVASVTTFTQAKVRYTQDTLSVINYLQGSLGLNRPLSSIWAIIPMSFLLDYVVSIQTLCDELDSTLNRSNAVQEMLQIGDTWSCYKTDVSVDCQCPPGTCNETGTHNGCGVVIRSTKFDRTPMSLSSVYAGWSDVGQVTASKAATVAEIAFQVFA